MAITKTKKKVTVPLVLSGEHLDFLKKVAKLSGLTRDDVVSIILSMYLVRADRAEK